MIDMHCHILPGLDDGPETMDESLDMCRIAYNDGIRTIVATPHFRPGQYKQREEVVLDCLAALKQALTTGGVPLSVVLAAEVTVTPELSLYLGSFPRLFINGTGKYFIAEFAYDVVPPQWNFFLSSLLRAGTIPVITHPERCQFFVDHPKSLRDFVEKGGLVQITAMSLTGEAGEKIREFAEHLLLEGLVHVIATDAHSATWRPPLLSSAVARAAELVGNEMARALVTDNPAAIIEGKNIAAMRPPGPEDAAKKKTWLWRLVSPRAK